MGTAIVLAGGDSKRIGYPKSLLKIGDKTLLEIVVERIVDYFQEVLLVTDRKEFFSSELPVRYVEDIFTRIKKSSLRGIHAGLSSSRTDNNFVIACDMPFIKMELVKEMYSYTRGFQVVVPYLGGHYQPLFAFYQRTCLPTIEDCLFHKRFKIIDFYARVNVKKITEEIVLSKDPNLLSFFNINTPDDYRKALAMSDIVR